MYYKWFVVLFLAALLNTVPGFRYYGQYWIPLLSLLPFALLGFEAWLRTIRTRELRYIIPLLLIIAVSIDVGRYNERYFEKGYLFNAEQAHAGNYPSALKGMLDQLKQRIQPGETFIMLGSQTQAYVELGIRPKAKHIYPRLIARDNEKNRVFQEEGVQHYINGNYDYALFSVTGLGWATSTNFLDDMYQRCFGYTVRNYDPIWMFNYDEGRFYNALAGDEINVYAPNQLILFKKR